LNRPSWSTSHIRHNASLSAYFVTCVKSVANQGNKALVGTLMHVHDSKKLLRYKRYHPLGFFPRNHLYMVLKWIPLSQFTLRNFRCLNHSTVQFHIKVRPHYARFVMIRVLFVKKIASELTPIDTNIKRRVQIRWICPFALFENLIWIMRILSRITNRA